MNWFTQAITDTKYGLQESTVGQLLLYLCDLTVSFLLLVVMAAILVAFSPAVVFLVLGAWWSGRRDRIVIQQMIDDDIDAPTIYEYPNGFVKENTRA